jgi:hypothetical protein
MHLNKPRRLIFAPAINSRSAISILQLALCVALTQTAARRGLFPDTDHSASPETRRNKARDSVLNAMLPGRRHRAVALHDPRRFLGMPERNPLAHQDQAF